MPTVAEHSRKITEHETSKNEAHDFIMSQRGAWAFIQKVGVVIAASASVITMIMKFTEHAKP